jgi:transposase
VIKIKHTKFINEDDVIKLYTIENLSISEICKRYKAGRNRIRDILINNNIKVDSCGKRKNKYIVDKENNIAKIELRRRNKESLWTMIDLDDLDKVLNFKYSWHSAFFQDRYYAEASMHINKDGKILNEHMLLHDFIYGKEYNHEKERVDHINHDTLDNRKSNLRKISAKNNSRNRIGRNSNNQTGYRNVAYIKSHKTRPYHVQLMVNGKNTVLGRFSDVDEAGAFAEEMREKYYGKYAGKDD